MARNRRIKIAPVAHVVLAVGEKAYICNRYPSLNIAGGIRFVKGIFKTGDPELMKKVERNEWYNVFIFSQKGDEAPVVPHPNIEQHKPTGEIETADGATEEIDPLYEATKVNR